MPHLEFAREIARRFNHYYGNLLKEPQAVLSPSPKVIGLDGRKMSKSYDNAIFLSDDPDAIAKKVRMMVTDPAQDTGRTIPATPTFAAFLPAGWFSTKRRRRNWRHRAARARSGCAACKARLTEVISNMLEPFRTRRAELIKNPGIVDEVLAAGLKTAKPIAEATLFETRKRLNID